MAIRTGNKNHKCLCIVYTVMAWYNDFAEGFEKPFKFVYDQGSRVVGLGDKLLDAAGNAAQGLGSFTL